MDYLNPKDLHKLLVTRPEYDQLLLESDLNTHGALKGQSVTPVVMEVSLYYKLYFVLATFN